MSQRAIIPIHILLSGDAAQLRAEIAKLVNTSTADIAAKARIPGQNPAGIRSTLGYREGNMIGQVNAYERAGLVPPGAADMGRKMIRDLYAQVTRGMREGMTGLKPPTGQINQGLRGGEALAQGNISTVLGYQRAEAMRAQADATRLFQAQAASTLLGPSGRPIRGPGIDYAGQWVTNHPREARNLNTPISERLDNEMFAPARARIAALAQANAATRQAAAAERELAEADRRLSSSRKPGAYQRLTASARARQPGAEPMTNEEILALPTLRQSMTSKLLTSAQYGASGALLYGGLQLGGDVLRQSTELQQELGVLRTQFDSLDETSKGVTFEDFRSNLQATAKDTGVEANQVALVERQLAGAFANPKTGQLDFARAQIEGQVALRYSQISPFSEQEITDSLTGIALAFKGVDGSAMEFERILDVATDLENRFGVLSPEIIKFAADLAPLGAELGLTFDQLAGIGAVAQKASAQSGAVVAEQLGRIIPSLRSKAQEVYEVFRANPQTRGASKDILTALAGGDVDEALKLISTNTKKLTQGQRSQIGELVGGRREARTLFALLSSPGELENVLGGAPDSADGAFDKRWQAYTQTVAYATKQMRRAVEEFGQALFDLFGSDLLRGGADVLRVAAGVALAFAKALNFVNESLGGIPMRAVGAYAAIAGITKIMAFTGGRTGMTAWLGATAFGGGIAKPGGLLSPYSGGGGLGAGGAPLPLMLRPSVQAAEQSALFSRWLSRDSSGAIKAGFGTSAAMAGSTLLPIAALLGTTYAVSRGLEARSEVQAAPDAVRPEIRKAIERGMSDERLEKKFITDKYGEGYGGLNTRRRWAAGWQAMWAGETKQDAVARAIIEERARADSDRFIAVGDYLATPSGSGAGLRSVEEAFRTGQDGLWKGRAVSASDIGKTAEKFFDYDMTGIEGEADVKIDRAGIKKLRDAIKKNPKNRDYQILLNYIATYYGQGDAEAGAEILGLGAEFDAEQKRIASGNKAVDEANKLTDPEGQVAPKYDINIANRTAAYEQGRGSIGTVMRTYANRLKALRDARDALVKAGFTDQAAAIDQQINEVMNKQASFITEDIAALRTLQDNILQVTGASALDSARQRQDTAARAFNAILSQADATPRQKGQAALELIKARQAQLNEELTAAKTPADIDRLISSGGLGIPDQARTAIIETQLGTGTNALAMDRIRTLSRQMGTYGLGADEEQIKKQLIAYVKGDRQYRDTLTEIRKVIVEQGGDTSQIDQMLTLLDSLNVIDPGSKIALDPEVARERKRALAEAKLNEAKARAHGDPVRQAQLDVEIAKSNLANTNPDDELAIQNATNALIDAEAAASDAVRSRAASLRQAAFDLQKVRASGNPVAQAAIDVQAALAQIANAAPGAAGDVDRAQGQVALANAAEAQRSAAIEIISAQEAYTQSLLSGDSVGQARAALSAAEGALGRARGQAERIRALQQVYEAQQALRNALVDVFVAQKDLAIAVAEGAGQTVQVAILQLQQAQARLQAAKESGVKGAQLDQLRADVVRAQNNVTTVSRNDRLGDLAYLYEFDKITANTYIALLQAELKKIPESNKEARREIERRIKALRDEMAGDLMFNIPSEIKLPTLYEARRLGQVSTSNVGGSYQDNRVINIELNEAQDGSGALDTIVDAINSPARTSGSSPGMGPL